VARVGAETGERGFSVGWVFSHTFGTLASNPVATLGIAFLFAALPTTAVSYLQRYLQPELIREIGMAGIVALGLFSFLLFILFSVITQGALVRATVARSEGRKAGFVESATAGLRVAIPLVLLGLLSSLGIAFGFLLLAVPGLILLVMWSVASPALVEERLGPIEALRRSAALTSGARWKIFGLMLIVFVVYMLLAGAIGLAIGLTYGSQGMINDPVNYPIGFLLTNILMQTLFSAFWGVLLSALFVQLRRWKDGLPAEALADIFA